MSEASEQSRKDTYEGMDCVVMCRAAAYEYPVMFAGARGDKFAINIGREDYDASDVHLSRDEAEHLWKLLGVFLGKA
jgi:hypothetical protein